MDKAREIVEKIEDDIRSRRGLSATFESIDDEIQDEIRDTWYKLVKSILG